ncbi:MULTISPECIES: hypothetical protein [unclassified Brevundimonas]|uniref:hypothetical protein n=1 Tax=unclassified Brevundimonas TaxID=2622653 RepID=UPI0025B9ACFB|nr:MULTISPECIES: hypothetical protein [unclassified Brevundimonas]
MILAMFIIGAFIAVVACWQLVAGDPHPLDQQGLVFTMAIGGLIMLAAILLQKGAGG